LFDQELNQQAPL